MAEENNNNGNIGALWAKQGKRGMYFTGTIEVKGEKIGIVVFQNNRKSKPNQPDYNILLPTPRGERPEHSAEHNQSELNNLDTTKRVEDDEEIRAEDIPF